jgi:hypothetical protein
VLNHSAVCQSPGINTMVNFVAAMITSALEWEDIHLEQHDYLDTATIEVLRHVRKSLNVSTDSVSAPTQYQQDNVIAAGLAYNGFSPSEPSLQVIQPFCLSSPREVKSTVFPDIHLLLLCPSRQTQLLLRKWTAQAAV